MSSMRQETVRRLMNTSITLPQEVKNDILMKFATKLINSGYARKDIKGILVEGIIKYEHLRWRDMLPKENERYHPLHMDSSFKKHERKLKKFLAETNWYLPDKSKDQSWRQKVPPQFKLESSRPIRRNKVAPTTVMKVPSTKNGALISSLLKKEHWLSQVSGYSVKYVEQSGTPLSLLFRTSPKGNSCGRQDCMICKFSDGKGRSKCGDKNIVYESCCTWCEEKDPETPYRYIGESSRTMFERAREHWVDASKLKDSSHIARHWAECHPDSKTPPLFKFTLVKKHRRALARQIHEAVRINERGDLNDRMEWKINTIDRLGTQLNRKEEEVLRLKEFKLKKKREGDLQRLRESVASTRLSFSFPNIKTGR